LKQAQEHPAVKSTIFLGETCTYAYDALSSIKNIERVSLQFVDVSGKLFISPANIVDSNLNRNSMGRAYWAYLLI
jgi:hypothetical protein